MSEEQLSGKFRRAGEPAMARRRMLRIAIDVAIATAPKHVLTGLRGEHLRTEMTERIAIAVERELAVERD